MPLPFPLFSTGGIPSARLFQRTFGFNVGGSVIFRTGGPGLLGGGALALRSAELGTGGATLRIGSVFSFATTAGQGAGWGFGFGNATMAGVPDGSTGSGSGSAFFGLLEAARVIVK